MAPSFLHISFKIPHYVLILVNGLGLPEVIRVTESQEDAFVNHLESRGGDIYIYTYTPPLRKHAVTPLLNVAQRF